MALFCSNCGAKDQSGTYCSSCGKNVNASSVSPSISANQVPPSLPGAAPTAPAKASRRKIWISAGIAILVVTLVTSYFRAQGANPFNGEVSLDVTVVEQSISDELLKQSGDVVQSVTCPRPMSGKPGDTRNCVVIDSTGAHFLAKVTIENTNGDITWRLE